MNTASPYRPAWNTEDGAPALLIGWTTLPSRDAAERVARFLVSENLAACAQIDGPIRSFYQWEGKLNEDEEFRLTLKFSAAKTEALEKRLRALHPYSVPQWI